MKNMNIK